MSTFAILFSILGAMLIGAVSPGPSFVLVSRISITSSRANGLAAALGMGVGGAIFACLAVGGLTAILLQVEWLYIALKILGGLYLIYLGVSIWRRASEPLEIKDTTSFKSQTPLRSFLLALGTQISNPKTAIVYASIFAALLPQSAPSSLLVALPPLIFMIEAGWYALVAIAFSASGPQSFYIGAKVWLDRLAGGVMGLLGARLIFESIRRPAL